MNMMQEKNTREYFLFLSGLAGVFVILALVLSWFHGRETQQILFEREQIFVSSLMEQGVSHVSIARALGSAETTAEGAELLRQIGHTQAASFRLFPSIDRSVRLFGAAAAGTVGILAILLLGMSIRFLWKRETLYRQAEGIITRFSEGDFRSHLPQTENGSIYQLFSAVDELAVALRAQSDKGQPMKACVRHTRSDIAHQL